MRRTSKKSVKWKKPTLTYETKINASLPPSVEGQVTGRLCVQLLQIKWDFNIPPPAPRLHVRLKWWGEAGAGTIFKVPVVSSSMQSKKTVQPSTSAIYDIKANWKKMGSYLNDMGSLILDVGLGDVSNEAMLIGQSVVKHMGRLSVKTPIEEFCEIANSDGITLGRIWVKLSMSVIREEASRQKLPLMETSCEEFIVGPAVRRQAPITKQTSNIHKEEFEDREEFEDVSDSPMDEAPKVLPAAKISARKETISLLLDRSKKLRDAMVNSILDTENTIKEAETLCDNTKINQFHGSMEFTGQHQADHNQSFVEQPLHADDDDASHFTSDGRIVDLVLKGHRVNPHHKNYGCVISDHLLSSDEDDTLDDSILTDSSGPMHNKELLQELLYSRDKDKSDESSLVTPAAAAYDSDSTTSSHSPTLEDKENVQKMVDKNEKQPIKLCSVPVPVKGIAVHKGLGKQGKMIEKNIFTGIGLDKLTRLGCVNAAKVLVGHVTITDPTSSNHGDRPTRRTNFSYNRGTYFVEYRFPVVSSRGSHRCTEYEVTRVASKKILNQSSPCENPSSFHVAIAFSHHSLFPLTFSSQVIKKWWNGMLFFRLYHRNPGERMPQLIGRARLSLRQVLRASRFCLDTELDVRSMSLQQAADQNVEEEEDMDHKIGTMKVHVELVPSSGKVNRDIKFDSSLETVASGSDMEIEEQKVDSELSQGTENRKKVLVDDGLCPPLLQMLLMIPDAFGILLPGDASKEVPPNSYLVCKMFCCNPYPRTQPIWNTANPTFSFKQTFPLRLSKSLLVKMCNNFMVVEVWHKTAGSVPDILIGLVKIALHQFFLAYSDEDTLPSLMKSDYPVVAVDSYCPIVDPISGKPQGHLAVALAMGNSTQISHITKELSSGNYKIHRPHQPHDTTYHQPTPIQSDCVSGKDVNSKKTIDDGSFETVHRCIQHVFEVVIEGVRNLSLFTDNIWGEADCFIQYHFPKQLGQLGLEDRREQGNPCNAELSNNDMELHPYRTSTALCTPDPSFSHETRHTLILPADIPVQKALMSCYRAGGMSIELWKRFYYPNIRDQLVAKATLPTAKLCAIVTMRRTVTASIQSFSLPLALTLKDCHTDGSGLVDLTIKYYDVRGNQSVMTNLPSAADGELQNQVTVSVGILRATGLKDAALNACKDNPVSMAFAAEVGVNAYAKLRLPLLSAKNEYSTKTIARSFNPEFSHFFDIVLPVKLGNRGHTAVATSLAERLEHTSAMLEVWHCMPKHQTASTALSSSNGGHTTHAVFSRRMGGALHDVLLGSVEVPLSPLLIKHTGINGWFPLLICSSGYATLPTAEQSVNSNSVGGIEISINFNSAEDRTSVLQTGSKLGWSPSLKGISINSQTSDVMATWETDLQFEIHVEGSLLPVEIVAIPTSVKEKYKFCYVRYKFYDRVPVVSKLFSITSLREDKAFYKIFHASGTQLTNTESLKWYLLEECLEVQLWLCESVKDRHSRPNSRDTLVGTASIPLLPLACLEGHNDVVTIKDSFVLFKAGLNSLNGQCVYVKITNTAVGESASTTGIDKNMIITESDGFACGYQSSAPTEGLQDTPSSSSSSSAETAEEEGAKIPPVSLEEMFQANVIIHEAMHVCLPNGFLDNGVSYCYVTTQPHPGLDKLITSTVECNIHLVVWESQALTHIPLKFLTKQCGGLQFHLWCKDTGDREERIGIVHLDLTPLSSGLRQLCGWYHIVDQTGQPKGQMKLSVTPTSRLGSSKSASLLSTKNTSSAAVAAGDQEAFSDIPNNCTSSFLVNHLRQNITELDVIHKNLEARLEQLETRTSHADHLTDQQNYQHQHARSLSDNQHVHQSLYLNQSGQHLNHQQIHTHQSDQFLHIDPLTNSDLILIDHSKHDHQPVHSTTMISHKQEEPVSSYPTTQHSRDQSPTNSSVDSSSSDDESSNSSSNTFGDNEMDPPSSTADPHVNITEEGTASNVIHKSTSSNSSNVLSDSCVSDSEDERLSVEADGQPCSMDRVVTMPLSNAVSCDQDDQHKMHVSIASNLTTVTPTELSSLTDDESNEQQSSLEDNRKQDEMAANSESSDESVTSPATSIVTQSLLNKDETTEERQPVTDNLRDITNSLSQPPPTTLPQEDEQTSFTLPPSSHSPVHKTPPMRFGLGNIPPKIQLPNFFMPPQELEQTMRRLKMTALTRPPPREFDHVSVTSEKHKTSQPSMVEERTRQNLSLQDMQRVARIFASKPS